MRLGHEVAVLGVANDVIADEGAQRDDLQLAVAGVLEQEGDQPGPQALTGERVVDLRVSDDELPRPLAVLGESHLGPVGSDHVPAVLGLVGDRDLGHRSSLVRATGHRSPNVGPMPLTVRAMVPADLPVAAAVGAAGMNFRFEGEVEVRLWHERIGYLLAADPGGAFVAERDGRVIGVAQAMQREALWVLSFLAVDPEAQRSGAGRALISAALGYGDRTHGLICSSDHPAALRLYATAGFSLRPALRTVGLVDRGALPPGSVRVRSGTTADLELVAGISRELRGAAGPLDHGRPGLGGVGRTEGRPAPDRARGAVRSRHARTAVSVPPQRAVRLMLPEGAPTEREPARERNPGLPRRERGKDRPMTRSLATGLKAAAVSGDIMITSPLPFEEESG